MKVIIAGFNVDKTLIDRWIPIDSATPEVISAAYARISRSSKTAQQLRDDALREIPQARNSNQKIIFELGHSSIAEHAVFNIDLIGISRYLAEFIQRTRLASFTEKSQRYVTFHKDYVIPEELNESEQRQYISLMDDLFAAYERSVHSMTARIMTTQASNFRSKREIENSAKEDARYILPLATKTQMGVTINARSMEVLLRRLHGLDLSEARDLYRKLHSATHMIAPSLIKYTETDDFAARSAIQAYLPPVVDTCDQESVKLIDHSPDPDARILAALFYERSGHDYSSIFQYVINMDEGEKRHFTDAMFEGMQAWHKMPRAFEMTDFTFELTMSQCCYAQFKRHRLCSMIRQHYRNDGRHVIPPAIIGTVIEDQFNILIQKADTLNQALSANHHVAQYCLTNAHTVNVLVRMNLRELYHFIRLRSDFHAQWEIREISDRISQIIRRLCPLSAKYLMGKSEFGQFN